MKVARLAPLVPVLLVASLLGGCTTPDLTVTVVKAGLTNPWDLTFVSNGTMSSPSGRAGSRSATRTARSPR